MYLKAITKNGVTRLYFYEAHYEPGSQNNGKGRTRQKLVKALGNLEKLKEEYDDPIRYFTELAKKETVEKKSLSQSVISIDFDEQLSDNENSLYNVGYVVLKNIYKELKLDEFWKLQAKKKHIKYDLEKIFRLLVFSRILFPASKKETYEKRGVYFESFDGFTLDDVYHSLDIIDEYQTEMQKWIYCQSGGILRRDMTLSYFDCTNYYFDIGSPDVDQLDDEGKPIDVGYRKRGPEKNHRPDPIVEMGLLMDRNGIPLAYELFPGNESEKLHMLPIIDRVKTDYSESRIIVVADRGLNTSDNIYYLNGDNKTKNNQRDGYVYGQSIRGASDEFKKWVLKDDYTCEIVKDGEEDVVFRHKSRIRPKQLQVNVRTKEGRTKKVKVDVDQKQMVYYSEKYAKKQRVDREIMVERAKDLIRNPGKYNKVTCAGSASYIKNISFDKETGEIIDGRHLLIDTSKIEEEEKYDGYYSIVTSELQMSDTEMRAAYRGLSRIEETFKISKSDLEARPIYVKLTAHIDAHFATCFAALVIMRLLQAKLGNRYTVEEIIGSLKSYSCVQIDLNTFQFCYFDKILQECEKTFDLRLSNKYARRLEIRRMLKY